MKNDLSAKRFIRVFFCRHYTFASVRVTQTSKTMHTTAIGTVAKSLPQNEVILLTLLISNRYIPYTDLPKISGFVLWLR